MLPDVDGHNGSDRLIGESSSSVIGIDDSQLAITEILDEPGPSRSEVASSRSVEFSLEFLERSPLSFNGFSAPLALRLVEALSQAPVEILMLQGNKLGREASKVIQSSMLPRVRILDLADNAIDEEGARLISSEASAPMLEVYMLKLLTVRIA